MSKSLKGPRTFMWCFIKMETLVDNERKPLNLDTLSVFPDWKLLCVMATLCWFVKHSCQNNTEKPSALFGYMSGFLTDFIHHCLLVPATWQNMLLYWTIEFALCVCFLFLTIFYMTKNCSWSFWFLLNMRYSFNSPATLHVCIAKSF